MSVSTSEFHSTMIPANSGMRIAVCDDEKNMRNLLVDVLEDDGWEVRACSSGQELLELLEKQEIPIPIVVIDIAMPGMDGFQVIEKIRGLGLDPNIIVITAFGTVDTVVRSMRVGAIDFIVKPFNNAQLKASVRRALESRDLLTQVELSHPRFIDSEFLGADRTPLPIIGQDERLKGIFNIIRRIANVKTSVLIQGESGTGKELVAQAIHYNGNRRDKPFVAVNCGALPETLLESEFFGHERGAFTGAHALQRGKFELANGGTLFLDEIGEMPLNLQVKLLRILQDGKFTRVGGEKENVVDVRIIAATNRDLQEAVKNRSFREDLFYRLNVIPIHLPSLRERRQDIPQLLEFFIERFCKRHKLPRIRLTREIIENLQSRPWQGNIRELQNVVEKAVILQEAKLLLQPSTSTPIPTPEPEETASADESACEHAEAGGREETPAGGHPEEPGFISENEAVVNLGAEGEIKDLSAVAADAQRAAVIRAIRICGGNKAEAAKRLGVSYKTLFNRINELGISISTNVE